MSSHLVIPDVHTRPGVKNDRMLWAGRLATDRLPDTIICLGDFFDMPSLCSYDKVRKSFEGRRFNNDIAAGKDGLAKFNEPFEAYNEHLKKSKKAQYRPRKIMLMGNHEQRLERCVNMHAELEGTLTNEVFGFEDYGWEVVPFLRSILVDGVLYNHYFVSGVKGESVSGANLGSALLAKNMVSSTCGHNHTLDWAVRTTPTGRTVMGLCGGCYLDPNQHEEYASAMEHLWWRGLIFKNNVKDGAYDLETMEITRVKDLYGKPQTFGKD